MRIVCAKSLNPAQCIAILAALRQFPSPSVFPGTVVSVRACAAHHALPDSGIRAVLSRRACDRLEPLSAAAGAQGLSAPGQLCFLPRLELDVPSAADRNLGIRRADRAAHPAQF